MSKKVNRAWTIYTTPSIARRIEDECPGVAARVFYNDGCSAFPEEQIVTKVKRYDPITHVDASIDKVSWRSTGNGRSFMPTGAAHPANVPERDWRPGLWAEAYAYAGDKIVAFLKEHPKP